LSISNCSLLIYKMHQQQTNSRRCSALRAHMEQDIHAHTGRERKLSYTTLHFLLVRN